MTNIYAAASARPQRAIADLTDESDDLSRTVAAVYSEYQQRLRVANALDFDDLIGETVAVLQAFPQIADHYRRRFRHILVDEYQDTNHAQYVLVRELVGRELDEGEDGTPPGELTVALRVSAHGVSASARQKIEAAGGTVTLLG